MEKIISRLDSVNEKHLYSYLYKIRSEYIKDETAIVRILTKISLYKFLDTIFCLFLFSEKFL